MPHEVSHLPSKLESPWRSPHLRRKSPSLLADVLICRHGLGCHVVVCSPRRQRIVDAILVACRPPRPLEGCPTLRTNVSTRLLKFGSDRLLSVGAPRRPSHAVRASVRDERACTVRREGFGMTRTFEQLASCSAQAPDRTRSYRTRCRRPSSSRHADTHIHTSSSARSDASRCHRPPLL